MTKMFCSYCGKLLTEGCDCEAIAAEEHERFVEEYNNRPETHAGWAFEDMLAMRRMER